MPIPSFELLNLRFDCFSLMVHMVEECHCLSPGKHAEKIVCLSSIETSIFPTGVRGRSAQFEHVLSGGCCGILGAGRSWGSISLPLGRESFLLLSDSGLVSLAARQQL